MARTKKVEVITEAKPHTIKKFELIEKYVEAWAYKILNYHGNPGYAPASGVIFIDCMSNSGVYNDINGNRVEGTALRVAQCLNNVFANYPDKKAILIFNDLESARVEHLKSEIENLQLDHVEVYYVQDIAKYIYEKYSALGRVNLDVVYQDLDVHPIFPSDGYKKEIKAELKDRYHVTITRQEIIFPQR